MRITIEPDSPGEDLDKQVFERVVECAVFGLRITSPVSTQHFSHVVGSVDSLFGQSLVLNERLKKRFHDSME